MKVRFFVFSIVGFAVALWISACEVPIEAPPIVEPEDIYYTVTFEVNGGNPAPEAQNVQAGTQAADPVFVVKTDFIFEGWYTDTEFTVQWDFKNDTVTSHLTLFAKWLPIYTVTFIANGGLPMHNPQAILDGGSVTQPNAMTKTGFGFAGWFLDDAFTVKWDFTNDTVDASIILYAKWDINYHTVTFDTGETGIIIISPHENIENIAFNSNAVQPSITNKPGYTFDGWYKDEDKLEQWDFDKDVVTEDITLYLKITPIQ